MSRVPTSKIKLPKIQSTVWNKMQAVNVPVFRLEQSGLSFDLRTNLQEDVFAERKRNGEAGAIIRHTAAQQLKMWHMLTEDPLSTPVSMCVSHHDSDLMPKLVAADLCAAAFQAGATTSQVYWHTLTGDPIDHLLVDTQARKALRLIVLTNLPTSYDHTNRMDSSMLKYEKVRDIIEVFHDATVCLVSTGTSPSDVFHKLQLPLDIAIRLTDKRHL